MQRYKSRISGKADNQATRRLPFDAEASLAEFRGAGRPM